SAARALLYLPSVPTRRSSDLVAAGHRPCTRAQPVLAAGVVAGAHPAPPRCGRRVHSLASDRWLPTSLPARADAARLDLLPPSHRSEEHTSELQSRFDLVRRLL